MEAWLNSIGLGERVQAFTENRIAEDQIDDLTEQDLRELGLTIGERKVFLRERAKRSAAPAVVATRTSTTQTIQAERRPLTIMFVDLVDSTGLGERLAPEDLVETVRRYREFASKVINRFGGRIARFIGDGILAYFCYPVANENDPERAVRAALAITDGIGGVAVPCPAPLRVRIGVATGRVLIQNLFAGEAAAEEHAVLGSVPNLAARLQALAKADGIVISEHTHARVQRHFTCRPLGSTDLRGFEQPHHPWVVEASAVRATEEAADPAQPATPFTGRERELDLLRACWRKVVAGEEAVVVVTGEAGIGKSRLLRQFCSTEIDHAHKVVWFSGSAFEEDRPFGPFIDYLVKGAGLTRAEGRAATLTRLHAFLGPSASENNDGAVLAALVGAGPDDPEIAALLPEQLRQRTISALVDHLLSLSAAAPLCVVVEDLHWLDPTSQDLLETVRLQMRSNRVMMLLTARDWSGPADLSLRLKPLTPEQVSAMIRNVFGTTVRTLQVIDHVASRTDGVPLYVEEVARLLVQRWPLNGSDERMTAAIETEIPASLDELLMAALDRTGPAKELAQVGSILGEEIRLQVLEPLAKFEPTQFRSYLADLTRMGILERAPGHAIGSLRFHHAMLRDTAYMSMARERRRTLHTDAARTLQLLEPDLPTTHPEVLAYHLAEGGLPIDAAPHWLEAARRSLSRSALTEASRVLRRGLDALENLAATPPIISLRLQFAALLGPALISLRGPNAAETQDLYTKAYELGHLLPEEPAHFPIYWGWWRLDTASEERALALLQRAKSRSDPGLLLQSHHCCWSTYFNRAQLDLCCQHVAAGFDIYDDGSYRQHARLYGNHDAKACAHLVLSQALWLQGRLGAALEQERIGLQWADDMDHLGTRVHARGMALLHRTYRRDYDVVLSQADELTALTSRHGMESAAAAALIFRGWAVAQLGNPLAGLQELEAGWARQREIATNEDYPVYLCLLAEVLIALGRAQEATDRIRSELDGFERSQLRIWIPELERVLGDTILVADPGNVEEARHHHVRALDLAEFQKVPMLGLRVALCLSRLRARSAPDQAAHLLASALAKLPKEALEEGGLDLHEARALAAVLPSP